MTFPDTQHLGNFLQIFWCFTKLCGKENWDNNILKSFLQFLSSFPLAMMQNIIDEVNYVKLVLKLHSRSKGSVRNLTTTKLRLKGKKTYQPKHQQQNTTLKLRKACSDARLTVKKKKSVNLPFEEVLRYLKAVCRCLGTGEDKILTILSDVRKKYHNSVR